MKSLLGNLSKTKLLSRAIHNASAYPETLTVVKFPEALREGLVEAATRYANAAHKVNLGMAKWGKDGKDPLVKGMPEEILRSVNDALTKAPATEEMHNLQEFIKDFTAGRIPVGIITGMPVKPIGLPKDDLRNEAIYNLPKDRDFNYNSFIQELMLQAIFGYSPFDQGKKPRPIALLDKPFGSFDSKEGLPWHIDGARQVEQPGDIPGIISLSCINSGDDITKFANPKSLFSSLSPQSREELLKPQFKYIEVSEYLDSSYFPVFLKKDDRIGIQLTTGHQVFAKTKEGEFALHELKEKLEVLSKTPGSTAEVTLEQGDLAISLNAPYKGNNPEDVVTNSIHLRLPKEQGVSSVKPDRLLTRQFYGNFTSSIGQNQEGERMR